jgi:hypothetical protein
MVLRVQRRPNRPLRSEDRDVQGIQAAELLPSPLTKPYALGIAPDHSIWYSGEWRDIIGKLDPDTGKVTEYPMPYSDNGMRDFFLDKDGHIWYGSPPNNRIGYFYISNRQRNAAAR